MFIKVSLSYLQKHIFLRRIEHCCQEAHGILNLLVKTVPILQAQL